MRVTVSDRPSPRTTALGAFAIWVPLFSILLWWAFTNRVGPEFGRAGQSPLPPVLAVFVSALTASSPAVLAALLIAERTRLRNVLRPSRTQIRVAVIGALATPEFMLLALMPIPFGLYRIIAVATFGLAGMVTGREFLGLTALLPIVALVWFLAIGSVRTGVRSHGLRRVILAICCGLACAGTILFQGLVYPGG